MWYDLHTLLSHNALFSFIISNRGAGKTYSAKRWAIRSFLKTGAQFIYLRRYKTEFDDFGKFFNDIKDEFPDVSFEVKGKVILINGHIAGYGISLSTALTKKSVAYPLVDKIIFDEFVIDSKVIHYLSNEVNAFLEFYETVARTRNNVRVLFISNAVTIVNPYFLFWNLKVNQKARFTKYKHMIIDNYTNQEFIDMKYQTRFGQIIKGTDYGNYAIENQYLKDNMNFVEKKTGDARFEFSITFNNCTYGFWSDYKGGYVYVSEDIDPYNKICFTLTDNEHKPNMLLVKTANKSYLLKGFIHAYENGYMRFEDMRIKNQCLEIFKLPKSR